MSKVLDSKKICTPRELGLKLEGGVALFNGRDHISVCKKFSAKEYYIRGLYNMPKAFPWYIIEGFGLILSDDIEAEKTEFYVKKNNKYDIGAIRKFVSEHPEKRWSDMFDEYQVEGSIGIDKFKAVFLPINYLKQVKIANYQKYLLNIIDKIDKYNLDVIDSCNKKFSELYESDKYNRDDEYEKIKKKIKEII